MRHRVSDAPELMGSRWELLSEDQTRELLAKARDVLDLDEELLCLESQMRV